VDVVSVYVAEAHPADEWVIYGDDYHNAETACVLQPKSLSARSAVAARFVERYNYSTDSFLIDSMDNVASQAYFCEPERLYVVFDGRLCYVGGIGPYFYNVNEVREFLLNKIKSLC